PVVAVVGAPRGPRAKPSMQPAPGPSADGWTLARRSGPGLCPATRRGPDICQTLSSSLVHGVEFQLRITPVDFLGLPAASKQISLFWTTRNDATWFFEMKVIMIRRRLSGHTAATTC